jgi:hypothetical protein
MLKATSSFVLGLQEYAMHLRGYTCGSCPTRIPVGSRFEHLL